MAAGDDAPKPISLFYSYSHKDEDLRGKLQEHLAVLRRAGLITEWHDRNIDAGSEWSKEIDRNLSTADIVLLLVSPSFIASEYCWSVEVTKALERHERGEAVVVPVMLRPCRLSITPFAKLQAVPKDAKPVTEWPNQDTAFDDIAAKVETLVKRIREERAAAEASRPAPLQKEEKAKNVSASSTPGVKGTGVERSNESAPQPWREKLRRDAPATATPAPPRQPRRLLWLAGAGAAVGVLAFLAWLAGNKSTIPEQPIRDNKAVTESKPAPAVKPAPPAPQPAPSPVTLSAGKSFTDCTDNCPEMVTLPGGTFLMGSPENETSRYSDEGPQRKVTIPPFAIGKYEVTFAEWDACFAVGGCNRYRPDDQGWGRDRRPVINVSWRDAQAYVAWLSKVTGKPYRLPTEAEWEYAARAGTTTPFALPPPKGSNDIAAKGLANCNGCGSHWDGKSTAPVGSFPANAWGLCDLHGNVHEWVEDIWHDSYQRAPVDGSAWTDGEGREPSRYRVIRGGSWYNSPRYLRSAVHFGLGPDIRGANRGFRVARTLD
ncbi:MAG: SUMF1/EgtB/PvdO family nonheme iron enzyme [Rhodospirillales bacterium]|nr:SUMF1/EgtB/PvdO family nonheme iron enzyme [Rhodospirillales bacterium]